MTATVGPAARQMARFVVLYDTPSDVEAFERHYNDVHVPLAKQYPGLRRYTRSHKPTAVIGTPCYIAVGQCVVAASSAYVWCGVTAP
ncbi:EthD family reductase [Streptomyces sp. NPDC003758]|uniref:EthD family reductase n=1 Tax=Streptomyces cynarae TaxID=2981134 RepID=A0ABY6EC07_9ACTN|nr:EthD family reductase [Streptomyces cynarae]UXY24104.1 EthD family reductase [Streptomyces cynarae]